MENTVKLPQLPWAGTRELEVTFPEQWQVEVCNMAGYDRPALSREEIRQAVRNPIGMPPIRESAWGKKEVVIIFDDMSRVTRVADIVPAVLEELAEAGITDSQIRFVAALGTHGALTRYDFIKKLGESVVSRFCVFNHNAFGNCTYAGTTSYGTKIYVNSEVMKCDYKIGIGSIVPHGFAGFGGGSKIILPGVSSIETAGAMHFMRLGDKKGAAIDFTGMGAVEENPLRKNIDEAGSLAGLNIKIDALLNMWGESVAIYAGAPKPAFAAGMAAAKAHYLTPLAQNCDIVITNTFAKANEGEGGLITGFPSLKKEGGDMVLICNAPEGHVSHFLLGHWGNISGVETRLQVKLPPQVNHLIIFNEYPDATIFGYITPQEKITMVSSWNEVLHILQQFHSNQAKVAIYPNCEIQYC